MKKKKVAAIIVFIWAALFVTDFIRVSSFEKPIFCMLANGYDDGGSGTYAGLGYTVDIKGNFVTEEESERGVTEFDMKLFGVMTVSAGVRCLTDSE